MTSRVLVLALSTGHKVGLAVVGAAFIVFALGSSFLFPRLRPQYPGGGLRAFIVVTFVFFFGMLAAVEVFGAEPKETKKSERAAQTESQVQITSAGTTTTQTAASTSTSTPSTTTAPAPPPPKPKPQTVSVAEKEFKITLASTSLHAGPATFEVKNTGALPHDLAIAGGPKTKLIPAGGTATLSTTLQTGPLELYCSVPGHKGLGMDVKLTVA